MVFLPFRFRGNRVVTPLEASIEDLIQPLPPSLLFIAAEDIDLDAEPEEGEAADLAEARDNLEQAEKRWKQADEEAAAAKIIAQETRGQIDRLKAADEIENLEMIRELETRLERAESDSEKASRKAAKAKVKSDNAARQVENLGGNISPSKEDVTDK
jgi:hypothetical protein